ALAGHTLTNAGTLRTIAGGADTRRFLVNGTLQNSGTLDLQGGATDSAFGALSLVNTNAIIVSVGAPVDVQSLTNGGGTITNDGSLLVKGTYKQGAGAAAGNPIVVGSGATLDLAGTGSAALRAGGNISIAGGPLAALQSLDLPGGN